MHRVFIVAAVAILAYGSTSLHASTGLTANELRTEIARLTKVADTIRAKLIALGSTNTGIAATGCLQSNLKMQRGVSGQSVYALQNFLVTAGVYSPSLVTGYFGPATEDGVKRWQAMNGIINYGTPYTTGYGLVGPSTLKAMHRGCAGGIYTGSSGTLNSVNTSTPSKNIKSTVEKYTLSINPTKGLYPLAVTMSLQITGTTCTSYKLDWGDSTTQISYDSNKDTNCTPKDINISRTHVYRTYGTYNATFSTIKGRLNKAKVLNSVQIDVLRSL